MEAFKICNLRLDRLGRRPYGPYLGISLGLCLIPWHCKWGVSYPQSASLGKKALNGTKSPLRLEWLLPLMLVWSAWEPAGGRRGAQSREDLIHHWDFTETQVSSLRLHWDPGWLSHDVWLPGLGWHWQSFVPRPGDSPGWWLGLVHHHPRAHTCSCLQLCSDSWLHNAENSICRFNLWWWIIFALSTNWELNPVMQRPENISKHSSCDLWCWKIVRYKKYFSFKLTVASLSSLNSILLARGGWEQFN